MTWKTASGLGRPWVLGFSENFSETLPEESDDPMGDLTPSLTRRAPVGLVKWEARQPRKSQGPNPKKESKELCCALGSKPLPVVWFGVFDQGLGLE